MNIKTPVHDFLKEYSAKTNNIRCHMPGNKGRYGKCDTDITEIYGADSLYENNNSLSGIISESERIATSLFGSKATFYSAGGSTLSIQTMLSLLKKIRNGKIFAGRYSHRSLISTAVLLDMEVSFLYPDEYLSTCINPEQLENALKTSDNEIAGIFLTSVDYYGGICDIPSMSRIAEKYQIPLLIDNAHGAYSVFNTNHPIKSSACMVADSAHKTLPALTGAAYLHIGDTKWTDKLIELAKNEMALFGSSSPSYLILESLDLCNRHIAEEAHLAKQAFRYVDNLKQHLIKHGYILKESDSLRIVINARSYGYSGFELADILRLSDKLNTLKMQLNISAQCEMCDNNYVVLLFSTITEEWETDGVAKILENIPPKEKLPLINVPVIKAKTALSPRKAYFSKSETIPLKNAVSRICADINTTCPPGVPLIMPGEVYDENIIALLELYGVKNVRAVNEN